MEESLIVTMWIMVLKEKEESAMGGSRRLIQKCSDTITMFVKPPHLYEVEFSIYIYVYKKFEYRDKLGKIITNGKCISYNQGGYRKSRTDLLESSTVLQSRRMP